MARGMGEFPSTMDSVEYVDGDYAEPAIPAKSKTQTDREKILQDMSEHYQLITEQEVTVKRAAETLRIQQSRLDLLKRNFNNDRERLVKVMPEVRAGFAVVDE